MATRQFFRRTLLFLTLIALPITLNYYSVYLIIQSASEGVANFSFFFWIAFAVTSLLFGRAACGYICPLGAIQETKDRMVEKKLVRVRYLKLIKYALAVLWVGTIVWAAIYAGGYKRVDLLYYTEGGVSVSSAQNLFMYYTVLLVALLPAFFLGKRAFCHYFCPWGVLNLLSTRLGRWLHLPMLHLRADPSACKSCKRCDRECPMSLPVNEMVQRRDMRNDECILCGSCVDNCPQKAIRYGWKR